MIQSLDALKIPSDTIRTIAVAVAQDSEVLSAIEEARRLGLANAILVGDEEQIRKVAESRSISLEPYTIYHETDIVQCCKIAVSLVREGAADILMKGLVDTALVMKEVLQGDTGLRTGRLLSHVAVFDVPGFDRLFYLTDAAMNIAPTLEEKKQIILNAVDVAHALDLPNPIVACVCAVEKVKAKMPATIDAAALTEAKLPGCEIIGPLGLDNSISVEAARHKGITDPRAGRADILLMPDIEAGNVMYKALVFLGKARNAGIVVGAKAPIIMTSRADSHESKLNSIALALYVASYYAKETQT